MYQISLVGFSPNNIWFRALRNNITKNTFDLWVGSLSVKSKRSCGSMRAQDAARPTPLIDTSHRMKPLHAIRSENDVFQNESTCQRWADWQQKRSCIDSKPMGCARPWFTTRLMETFDSSPQRKTIRVGDSTKPVCMFDETKGGWSHQSDSHGAFDLSWAHC